MNVNIINDKNKNLLNTLAIKKKNSFIIFDNYDKKQLSLIERYYDLFKKENYNIKLLNLYNPKCSDCFNPLIYLESDLETIQFAKYITKNVDEITIQSTLLESLLLYFKNNKDLFDDQMTFKNIVTLLKNYNFENNDDICTTDLIFKLYEERFPLNIANKQYELFKLNKLYDKKRIVSELANYLSIFNEKYMENLTNINTINLMDFSEKASVLFIEIPDYDFFKPIVSSLTFILNKLFVKNKNFDEFFIPFENPMKEVIPFEKPMKEYKLDNELDNELNEIITDNKVENIISEDLLDDFDDFKFDC
jgi:hypothetical protein